MCDMCMQIGVPVKMDVSRLLDNDASESGTVRAFVNLSDLIINTQIKKHKQSTGMLLKRFVFPPAHQFEEKIFSIQPTVMHLQL